VVAKKADAPVCKPTKEIRAQKQPCDDIIKAYTSSLECALDEQKRIQRMKELFEAGKDNECDLPDCGTLETSSNVPFKVVCYFTSWGWYRPDLVKFGPEDIDPKLCTHIIYAYATLDLDQLDQLVVKSPDPSTDQEKKFFARVTEFKTHGVKVLLGLGGWNDSRGDKYSKLVTKPTARTKFVRATKQFLQKHNFDGLDLAWEYPVCWHGDCNKGRPDDKKGFTSLVVELKQEFTPLGLLLSANVANSKQVIDKAYNVKKIAKHLDWINVMTYDYSGSWDQTTGHVAPLYVHPDDEDLDANLNFTISYLIEQGSPKDKLVVGMPLYGASFTLAHKDIHGLNAPKRRKGNAGNFTREQGFLAYYDICSTIDREKWTVVQDVEGRMGPYAYHDTQWVSYDDVKMVQKKSEYVKDMGLGGAMIWAIDLDDFKGTCGLGKSPLTTMIANVLAAPRPRRRATEDWDWCDYVPDN